MNRHAKWTATLVGCVALAPGCAAQVSAVVEAELDRLVREDGATRVAIVVLDPRDGRILAAAGRGPDADREPVREAAMASAIKPLTVAAAFDNGLDPMRRFAGHGGRWRADPETELRDLHPRESMNAQDAIVASSNIGTGQIVEAVGAAPVAALFDELGARVDQPGSWTVHGAGHGVKMSPLRLAMAYAAFANGGLAIEPTPDGSGESRRVMSESTASTVAAILEAAVGNDGTGRRARVDGHRVAGKTGTSEGGAAIFAGFAPVAAPRFVVVVRAEVPRDAWGGTVAAPSFARIAAALLADR